jgi:hypothetical protein
MRSALVGPAAVGELAPGESFEDLLARTRAEVS